MLTSLEDIVSNVQIESNFCIRHPNYQPFALPGSVAARFQQTPEALQHKYLSLLLRNFLYGIYYNGSLQNTLALNADLGAEVPYQNLENNTVLGIDVEFYQGIDHSNCGTGYFEPGWQVLRDEPDGSLAAIKDGLTLHLERSRHLAPDAATANVGDFVSIWMPRNRVENGFYVAVSNVGQERQGNPDSELKAAAISFNLTSEGASVVMESLTRQLNQTAIPFTFKVLYNPSEYGRYDSGMLYFQTRHYAAVRQVLQVVYAEHQSYFQQEIPLFTKFLAPGLSLAEEPVQQYAAQESFGMNRCQIIANGLLESGRGGDESTAVRMTSIQQQFSRLGIDLQRPYLNPNSEDIYSPL